MQPLTIDNFGLAIAYLLPGFTALWGIASVSGTVQNWFGTATTDGPTVGGFLYVTLASLAVGLAVSTVRWAVIDAIHHRTGISEPQWDFGALRTSLPAFEGLVQNHYRYYQFHANMLVTLVVIACVRWGSVGDFSALTWIDFGLVPAGMLLFAGSRDTLRKYYTRTAQLSKISGSGTGQRE